VLTARQATDDNMAQAL